MNHNRDYKDSVAMIIVSKENVLTLKEAFQENLTHYITYISEQSFGTIK